MLRISTLVAAAFAASFLFICSASALAPAGAMFKAAITAANKCNLTQYNLNVAYLLELRDHAKDPAQQAAYDAMLQNIPEYDLAKCPPKQAAPNSTAFRIVENESPRPQDRVYLNSNYYGTALVGGNVGCVEQSFFLTNSPAPDAHSGDIKETCGSQFLFGGTIGTNIGSIPASLPLNAGLPPELQRATFGFEVTFLDGQNSFTATGTPVTAFPVPGDQYVVRDNWFAFANGTVTVPIFPSVSLIGRVGLAAVDKSITYNCISYCTAGGFAPYSEQDTEILWGGDFGGGFMVNNVFGPGTTLEANVIEVITADKSFQFNGPPGGISVGFHASQHDTIATLGARFPLTGPTSPH